MSLVVGFQGSGLANCLRYAGPDSEWSLKDDWTRHTITDRNSRCRKGLEPSWRLSKTTGLFDLSGFRVAVSAPRRNLATFRNIHTSATIQDSWGTPLVQAAPIHPTY